MKSMHAVIGRSCCVWICFESVGEEKAYCADLHG